MQHDMFSPAHDGSGAADRVPPIEQLGNELAALRKNMADLLRHVGQIQICTGPNCRQEIHFVLHRDSGRMTPYNLDGSNHFRTCIDRELFKRRKNAGQRDHEARS